MIHPINVVFSFDDENFIAASETEMTKTETITSTGAKTTRFTFSTKADNPDGNTNGLVTATLVEGAGYALPATVADRSASIVILDDALPVISIGEIAPVNESAGEFAVTLISNIQLTSGYDLVIDTLLVVDTTTSELPTYNPQLPTTPIVITNTSTNNATDAIITFTKDSIIMLGRLSMYP